MTVEEIIEEIDSATHFMTHDEELELLLLLKEELESRIRKALGDETE